MKFGIRIPSLKRRIAARTSIKRIIRHSAGLKMPRGMGFLTSPKRALYNKVYNKTSVSVDRLLKVGKTSKKETVKPVDYVSQKIETKSYARNIYTNRKHVCKKCQSDSWALVTDKILFISFEVLYCENCHTIGTTYKLGGGETREQFIKQLAS